MIEKSKALEKLYYKYTHLPLGGKLVRCPYWSNRQRIFLPDAFKGKGTPKEITQTTLETAKKEKVDLSKLSSDEIRKFMEHYRIGVDCSGFVYHLANALDKQRSGKGIDDYIQGVRGKGVRKVNAFCLTNEKNSVPIKKVKDIKVGDFIRFQGGKHIAIILRIKKNTDGEPKEIVYAHSGILSAVTGVHSGRILVTDSKKDIKEQKWPEKSRKGYDFKGKYFFKQEDDGIKRLKIWI